MKRVGRRLLRWASYLPGSIALAFADGLDRGVGVRGGPGLRIRVTDGARCKLGDGVVLGRGVDVSVKYGKLEIGARTFLGQGCVIVAREQIVIGADCLLAEYVSIRDQDHAVNNAHGTHFQGFVTAPIVIGDNVWIGAKATVTMGVTIGSNVIIGAGAVVTRDIPSGAVAVGVPARVIRQA